MANFTDQQLQAYLDESLEVQLMAAIESQLRSDGELRERLVEIVGARSAGVHGIGEIWRRNRLTCPNRQQLGSYLLGVADSQGQDYIRFHIETVGCRVCRANLDDLQRQREEQKAEAQTRRQRILHSSVGYLRK